MKLLILTIQNEYLNMENAINKISYLSSIYAYFYMKYLKRKNKDIEIDVKNVYSNFNSEEFKGKLYDHCLITLNRGTTYIKDFESLRKIVKKKIFTICGSNKIIGKEDYLIHYVGKRKPNSIRVNWMVDHELLVPKKDPTKIIILVDHKYYGDSSSRIYICDKTDFVLKSLLEYKKNNNNKFNDKEIVIKHIISNNIITVNKESDFLNTGFNQGNAVGYGIVSDEYNKADIYVNTHIECMGLTNLECAMAGALILTFNDFLKNEYRNQLDHIMLNPEDQTIDWKNIFNRLDPQRSRNKVIKCNFENYVGYIYDKYMK